MKARCGDQREGKSRLRSLGFKRKGWFWKRDCRLRSVAPGDFKAVGILSDETKS